METFTPTAENGQAYRRALGRFATGVALVTVPSELGPIAMTINSFTSVSLSPPLILWSLDRHSSRYDLFARAPRFSIHVLAEEQRPLSDHFARPLQTMDGIAWTEGPHGVPYLPDPLARFLCRTEVQHDGGDHLLIIARVENVMQREGKPLVFYGGYRQLAEQG